ncbi:PAS domain-containing protein [Neorhizobium sp. NCHU2750]|uniref:PAS domain-containing protein n=1 Tax=Neorhizobium sp. NCHU2750 TaxID=1825976 RepID=UPI000E730DD9|nr:aerotaxis receptor [Neorhizobium sp. NCHU2750]
MKLKKHISETDVSIEIESPFYFNELFFSRTDGRGKIQSGNEVFQRISQYSWSELAGRPHNIIRHPAMPRAVFWLLWDRLKKGLPTGAYVKNRAKDGRFYWVYAIITPCEGGFLSVRLKPGSALFDVVQAEYAKLLRAEGEEELSPAESARLLLARLSELGFDSYDAFMAESLVAEFASREEQLERRGKQTLPLYARLIPSTGRLLRAARVITEGYQAYRFVPLNLLVHAGQMGDAGAAIATISNNYNLLSDQIQQGLRDFLDAAVRVAHTIHIGAFLLATSYLQQEVVNGFQNEEPIVGVDHPREQALLRDQLSTFQAHALKSLGDMERELKSFFDRASEMKRLALGLAAIRVMGKVETGRLNATGLKDLITDLEAFQEILQSGLSDILHVNNGLRSDAAQLMEAYSLEQA